MKKLLLTGLLLTGLTGLYGCGMANPNSTIEKENDLKYSTSQETPPSERYATEYVEPETSTVDVSVNADEVDMSDAPIGFQKGYVIAEHFIVMNTNFDEWITLGKSWDGADLDNGAVRGELIEAHKSFAEFLEKNLYFEPATPEEEEICLYLSAYREDAENMVSSRISYLESLSNYDLNKSQTYHDKAKANLIKVMNVMNEYELFYD